MAVFQKILKTKQHAASPNDTHSGSTEGNDQLEVKGEDCICKAAGDAIRRGVKGISSCHKNARICFQSVYHVLEHGVMDVGIIVHAKNVLAVTGRFLDPITEAATTREAVRCEPCSHVTKGSVISLGHLRYAPVYVPEGSQGTAVPTRLSSAATHGFGLQQLESGWSGWEGAWEMHLIPQTSFAAVSF